MEMKNVYEDPAYAAVKKDLHLRLDSLRKRYKDNTAISQRYVDEFLEDASQGKVFGVTKEEVSRILARRRKN
jgi:hypothetical protein